VLFSHLDLHPALLKAIKELGFIRPTAIQREAIPPVLAGRDLVGCAQTGSGKTAAFLLPIIHHLIDRPRRTTRALVLAPTRELAAQIARGSGTLAVHTPVSGAAVYGGVGMAPQEHAFRSGVDIIVATPGRLIDHMRSSYASLQQIEYLVLDEADRMLDMGFLPEIRRSCATTARAAPDAVLQRDDAAAHRGAGARHAEGSRVHPDRAPLGARRWHHPGGVSRSAGAEAGAHRSPAEQQTMTQALVFTRTKHRANRLADYLVREGIRAERIHGNRSQAQRTRRSPVSRTACIPCSWPPTSRRAASTSRRSAMW
jgi:ATP-dependent RNA helicase RhlE